MKLYIIARILYCCLIFFVWESTFAKDPVSAGRQIYDQLRNKKCFKIIDQFLKDRFRLPEENIRITSKPNNVTLYEFVDHPYVERSDRMETEKTTLKAKLNGQYIEEVELDLRHGFGADGDLIRKIKVRFNSSCETIYHQFEEAIYSTSGLKNLEESLYFEINPIFCKYLTTKYLDSFPLNVEKGKLETQFNFKFYQSLDALDANIRYTKEPRMQAINANRFASFGTNYDSPDVLILNLCRQNFPEHKKDRPAERTPGKSSR